MFLFISQVLCKATIHTCMYQLYHKRTITKSRNTPSDTCRFFLAALREPLLFYPSSVSRRLVLQNGLMWPRFCAMEIWLRMMMAYSDFLIGTYFEQVHFQSVWNSIQRDPIQLQIQASSILWSRNHLIFVLCYKSSEGK